MPTAGSGRIQKSFIRPQEPTATSDIAFPRPKRSANDGDDEVDAAFRYSSQPGAESGFKQTKWAPLGTAPDGGCLLLSLTSQNRLQIYSNTDGSDTGDYELMNDLSADLMRFLKKWGVVTRDQFEGTAVQWAPTGDGDDSSVILLGTKAGSIISIRYHKGTFKFLNIKQKCHESWVSAIEVCGDTNTAVTSSVDGEVKLWHFHSDMGELIETVTDADFHAVQMVKTAGTTVFIVKTTTIHSFVIGSGASDPNGITIQRHGEIQLPLSAAVSGLNPISETQVLIVTCDGRCMVFQLSQGIWNVDDAATKSIHDTIANIKTPSLKSNSLAEKSNEDVAASDEEESWSPFDSIYLTNFGTASEPVVPFFSGCALSYSGRHLALCFTKIAPSSAIVRPPAAQKSSFVMVPVNCESLWKPREIRSHEQNDSISPLYKYWDCLKIKGDEVITDDLSHFVHACKTSRSHDDLEKLQFTQLKNSRPDDTRLQSLLLTESLYYDMCPVCSQPLDNQNLKETACPSNHRFSRCSDTFAPCLSGRETLRCSGCERLRISKFQKWTKLVVLDDNATVGENMEIEPPCRYCGCLMKSIS